VIGICDIRRWYYGTNETAEFPREGSCPGYGGAQGIEAVSFCPVIRCWAKDTSVKPGFLRRFKSDAVKNAPKFMGKFVITMLPGYSGFAAFLVDQFP
jgi:hypothetical protein